MIVINLVDNRSYTGAICTIGFCLTKHTSPFASAIAVVGRVCAQHPIFQLWRKLAIWRESSSAHFKAIVEQYLAVSQYPNMLHPYLKGSTRYWSISRSAIIPLLRSLKCSTSSLVGLPFPSRSEDKADTYSALGSPIITSASCSSGASRDNCHGGRYRVLLMNLYASFLSVTESLVSAITSPPY